MATSPTFIGVQQFIIECTINGALLHPVWAYVDKGIYLVRQLPLYSVVVHLCDDNCDDNHRNMKGLHYPNVAFRISFFLHSMRCDSAI